MPPKMKQCLIKISSSSEESSQGENTEMQVAPSIQAAMKRDPSPAIRNRPNKRIRLNENKRPQGNKTSAINSVATLDYSSPIRKPMNQSALSASYRQTVPLDITSKQSPRTKQRTLTLLNNNVPTTKPILAGSDLKHAFTSTSKLSPENKRALTAIVKPELEEEASFPTLTVAEQTELLAHNRKRATLTHITATIQSHLPDKAEQSHPASPESNPGVKVDSDHNLENDVRANSPTSFMEGPYKLPDISFFESHCWVCEIRLKEINGEPCLYGLNLHPVLQVPICSLCCDLIVIAQEEQVEDQNLTEDCIGCGKGDRGDLFLCDCCPNVFCTFCVAQAHGGGSTGTEKANSLLNDHDRSWACLECNAPAPLSGIQIHGKVINTDYLLSDDERDALTLDLFEKLMKVENEIVECEKWAKQDWLDQEKAKIASEFANQFNDSSELEKHVENEMAIYERQCLDHQHRLMDNVDTLQEKLECLNFDWQSYYKTFRDFASYEEESEWRAQAELSMTKVEPRQGENCMFVD